MMLLEMLCSWTPFSSGSKQATQIRGKESVQETFLQRLPVIIENKYNSYIITVSSINIFTELTICAVRRSPVN